MAFEETIGQEKIIEILKASLRDGKLTHAYLFEGAEGLGKKQVALELAKGILCSGEGARPCHSCQFCRRIELGNHPEVTLIEEEGAIKIERVRDLQKDIQMKPYEGSKKVYIINNADHMTTQAQNALLKTLEEPPSYATLILLTVNANALLSTILSRCQVLKFRPVEISKIQEILVRKHDVSLEESKMIASFSNGIYGRAIKLLEDEEFRRRRGQVLQLTEDILRSNVVNLLDKIEFFLEEKNHIEEILEIMTSWYRDIMVFKETQEFPFIMNCDRIEEIVTQSNRIGLKKLRDIIFIIDKAKGNIRSNVNYQLNIEVMLLNIQEVLS